MLPGAAGFSGPHRRNLEELASVEPYLADAGAFEGQEAGFGRLESNWEEPTSVVKKHQATGRRKSLVAFSCLLFSLYHSLLTGSPLANAKWGLVESRPQHHKAEHNGRFGAERQYLNSWHSLKGCLLYFSEHFQAYLIGRCSGYLVCFLYLLVLFYLFVCLF